MYDDWADIDLSWNESSVLERFSGSVARTVAVSVVDDLARQISANASCSLAGDSEVQWCMQVLCYGLELPFSTDYPTIRNVVKIYCDWLTCLIDEPSVAVPPPLLEQPAKYSRDIINHLHHLFVIRSESGSDVILRQAKECHFVLRCLQHVAVRCKSDIKREIWPEILRFLLSVNDSLLSPPYERDDISDQLCARTLGVLFELWISACFTGQFPAPSFWKTFQSLCRHWRHRIPLIDQWARACHVLTAVQLKNLYGPNYCKMMLVPEDQKLVPQDADPMLVSQTWFRILHLIGSPAEILNSHNFDNSPKFREYINLRSGETGVLDPSQHPCLNHLPYGFFRAVYSVNLLVSCFLGQSVDCASRGSDIPSSDSATFTPPSGPQPLPVSHQPSVTQVPFRRGGNVKAKENRSQSVYVGKGSVPTQATIPTPDSLLVINALKNAPTKYVLNVPYSPAKPSVDSLLRLFGEWLFSCAAVKHVDHKRSQDDSLSQKSMGSQHSAPEGADTSSMSKSSSQSELARLSSDNLGYISSVQAGKAEAAAALCKIFCSHVISEKVAENHVAKFCTLLLDVFSHEDYVVHASVIFHGVNVFRVGLRGVELLLPCFLDCLDHFITDPERMRVHPSIADVELRRACLDLLSSIIVYPTHFGTSAFNDINRNTEQHTFIGFRARMLRILLNTLKFETDSNNIQVALGLLCIFYQSCYHYERTAGTLQNMNYIKEMLRAILALLSDCLCGKWSSDYAVCISALDCLVVLSDVGECEQYDMSIFDRVIISICRFIEIQLSRPPPAHSRDLHSTVVAAYACLECWIVAFPAILQDDLCLSHVTDTIQLGVTGSKPQSKEVDGTDTKKPASQRVNDAAEQLLHAMFCRAAAPFSTHEPMENETYLINTLGIPSDQIKTYKSRFLYALLDNTTLIAVLEAEAQNEKGEVAPAAAVVLRSPFAAVSSWVFRLDAKPRVETAFKGTAMRPDGADLPPPKYQLPNSVPSDVERFGKCKADESFPSLRLTAEAERTKTYIQEVGKQLKWHDFKKDAKFCRLDAKPPTSDGVIHTTRLLLQDLGYLSFDSSEDRFRLMNSNDANGTISASFLDDLSGIDRCPARFVHTAHLFYVENGQVNVNDILSNGDRLEKTASCFRRFLSMLGVSVNIGKDRVWTGHWRSAYMENNINSDPEMNRTIDGTRRVLYWASPLAEIAFVMPSTKSKQLYGKPYVSSNLLPSSISSNPPDSTNIGSSLEDLTIRELDEGDQNDDLMTTSVTETMPSPAFRRRPAARLRTCVKAIAFLGRRKHSYNAIGYNPPPVHVLTKVDDDWSCSDDAVEAMDGSSVGRPGPPLRSKSMISQDYDNVKTSASITAAKLKKSQTFHDYRFLIVWLEKFEDHASVPLDDLASLADVGEPVHCADAHRYVVFICPYENGLYRIKLSSHWSKLGYPSPLVDGVVVGDDVLSLSIRQTILSVGSRRRLEQEGYTPQFVKRRQKIQEFASKYASNAPPAESFHALLLR